jgi:tryptophan synthase alpha chain
VNDLPIRGVEVGFPFSDPIADGPVIQEAFTRALAAGTRVEGVFQAVSRVRGAFEHPIVAMVSASIVYRAGVGEFIRRAAGAGFDGLIVPDLSLEEAPHLGRLAREAGLRLCMLIAPTTPPARQRRIAEVAGGFLYYVSVQGVTGERSALPPNLAAHVAQVRAETRLPVLVGFGISRAGHVREVCGLADGAIVGSAIVRRMEPLLSAGGNDEEVVAGTLEFIRGLAG